MMFFMCFSDWIRKVIQVRVLLPCFSCRWKRPWLHNFDFELFQNYSTQSFISQYQTSKSALLHLNFLFGVWYDIKHTALLSCMCLSFLVSVKPVYSSHPVYIAVTLYIMVTRQLAKIFSSPCILQSPCHFPRVIIEHRFNCSWKTQPPFCFSAAQHHARF